MLIKFRVISGPSIEMFETQALKMIRAMGLSETVPSALLPEDVPSAITQLESTLNGQASGENVTRQNGYSGDAIDAKTRAFPLLELLRYAVKEHKSIMWDTESF